MSDDTSILALMQQSLRQMEKQLSSISGKCIKEPQRVTQLPGGGEFWLGTQYPAGT